ncbi:hypothetical protein HYW74_02675 [Candidatus Pacearchaeota archaeon]|nr:hypothetical protein [Candidatus Pacearchaeota archaeon]
MITDLYQKVYQKYIKKWEEVEKEATGSSKFRDIAANLIVGLNGFRGMASDNPNQREWREGFCNTYELIKTYFRLMDTFPEFREAELKTEKGYFPDISDYVCSKSGIDERKRTNVSAIEQYVSRAKQRLEGKV